MYIIECRRMRNCLEALSYRSRSESVPHRFTSIWGNEYAVLQNAVSKRVHFTYFFYLTEIVKQLIIRYKTGTYTYFCATQHIITLAYVIEKQ